MIPGRRPRPPDKQKPRHVDKTARLPKGSTGERANFKNSISATKPYIVVVDSPNRSVTWGTFADRALAERTKAQLCKWGMAARVVEHGEVAR